MWGLAIKPALERPPLVPLMEAMEEESCTALVQEDGTTVDDEAMV